MAELHWINLNTTDPAFNLAAEQYIFDCLPRDRAYFMLWQNDNAVIIGKYQNTQAEIDENYVAQHGIRVVRRLSGGGAVYHDLGNLNFTFIADAGDMEKLNMRVFCEPIVAVLRGLGIPAEINGRNDMTIEGRKFSGNAQYMRGGRIMHHGTLMFQSDLSVLTNALRVEPGKIESKGMKSVRSRVTNIGDYITDGTGLEEFRCRLITEIAEKNGGEEYRFTDADIKAIEEIRNSRYARWDWNFGKSPAGVMKREMRIPGCGKVEAYIETEHGLISSVEFRGDFFSTKEPSELAEKFIGRTPDEAGFRAALDSMEVSDYFKGMDRESMLALLSGEF